MRESHTPHHNPPDPEPPADRSDAVVLTWTPRSSPPRRIVFEPRSDGDWTRYDQALGPEEVWRTRGTEVVDNVGVEVNE